jgi:hypothetical protein
MTKGKDLDWLLPSGMAADFLKPGNLQGTVKGEGEPEPLLPQRAEVEGMGQGGVVSVLCWGHAPRPVWERSKNHPQIHQGPSRPRCKQKRCSFCQKQWCLASLFNL